MFGQLEGARISAQIKHLDLGIQPVGFECKKAWKWKHCDGDFPLGQRLIFGAAPWCLPSLFENVIHHVYIEWVARDKYPSNKTCICWIGGQALYKCTHIWMWHENASQNEHMMWNCLSKCR